MKNSHAVLPRRALTNAAAWVVLFAMGLMSLPYAVFAAVFPGTSWATRTPAEVGLKQAKLEEFRSATGNLAGIIIKDGYQVYIWGARTAKFDWASAAKPVISTMLFFAIHEGKLPSVNALVKEGWELIPKDHTMTFHHLANMTSGYALPENPGARWGYNDYAISLYNKTLFDRVFGQSPDTVVRASSRLGPLQFQDGALYGTARGGFGLVTTPRDFARIGWFWLNRGNWNGAQLLPTSYFDSFMKPQVPSSLPRTAGGTNDYLSVGTIGGGSNLDMTGQGRYGYNWWFNPNKITWPDAPADTIQASGHRNAESMFIIPSLSTVVAWRGIDSSSASTMFTDANRYLKILVQAHQ